MKKFFKLLVFILIVPFAFALGGCKKDKNKNNGNTGGGQQQEQPVTPPSGEEPGTGGNDEPTDPNDPTDPEEPGTGGGDEPTPDEPTVPDDPEEPEEPDEPDEPVEPVETFFKVSFDYALPSEYDYLLEDFSVDKNTKETVDLPTISNQNLRKYFLGWFDKKTNQAITTGIAGTADEVKNVYAKWNETDLKKFYFTEGLTFEEVVVDEVSFAAVKSYAGTETKVVLPKYVVVGTDELALRVVGTNAFKNSNTVEIMQSIEGLIVEDYAFAGSKIKSFDFSKTYEIHNNAFDGSAIENVVLSSFVNVLGNGVFSNCESLVSVDFSKLVDVLKVPESTFAGCTKLAEIKLGNSIATVENYAFEGCLALKNIAFLTTKITEIGTGAFKNCSNIESVEFSEYVQSLGYNVFEGCTKLSTLKAYKFFYEYELDTLSTYMSDLSSSLTEVQILGTSVTVLPTRYFENYAKLTKVVLPNQITRMGDYAFAGCEKLENFNLPTALDIEYFKITSISDTLWYKNLNEVIYLNDGKNLFFVPKTLTGVVEIQAGTETIIESAFKDNTNIISVKIPSSVKTIGKRAFYGCTKLESVVFEENSVLTTIDERMFYGCSTLNSINLSACLNLSSIGTLAFSKIGNVENFELPKALSTLGNRAFAKSNIENFSIDAQNADFSVVDGVLFDKETTKLIMYPVLKEGSLYEIPNTVTLVQDYAFEGVKSLTTVYITSEVVFGNGIATNVFSGSANTISVYSENRNVEIDEVDVYLYHKLSETEFAYEKVGEDYQFTIINETGEEFGLTQCFVKINDGENDLFFELYLSSGVIPTVEDQYEITDLFV